MYEKEAGAVGGGFFRNLGAEIQRRVLLSLPI